MEDFRAKFGTPIGKSEIDDFIFSSKNEAYEIATEIMDRKRWYRPNDSDDLIR
jgi:hypothetical protein